VYATINTNGQEVIKMPEDPQKAGYEFRGWYWDEGTWQQPFTANSLLDAPLSSNMRVYAYFAIPGSPYPDGNGGNNGDNENNENDSMNGIKTPYKTRKCDTDLIHSYTDDVNNYFIFKIGEVEVVPLHIFGYLGHDGIKDRTLQITTREVDITKFMSSQENKITEALSGDISAKIAGKLENIAGVTFEGLMSAEQKKSIEAEICGSLAYSVTEVDNETFQAEIMTEVSKETIEGYTITGDMPAGTYYSAVTCACEVYVTLICNIPEKTCSYAYSTLVIEGSVNPNDSYFSESQIMRPDSNSKLEFDTSVLDSIDPFGDIEGDKFVSKTLDFSQIFTEAYGNKDYDFASKYAEYFPDNYDATSKALILHSKVDNEDVDRYIIKGMYGKQNDRGYIIDTVLKDICIKVFSNHDIEIEFDSFAFVAPELTSAVYIDPQSNENINLTIKSSGKENLIIGCAQVYMPMDDTFFPLGDSFKKYPTIDAGCIKAVNITGYAPLSVVGGNGMDFAFTGEGGIAISAKAITVDMGSNATVILQGGNGANANNRAADDNDGNGSDGKDGYQGAKGGDAIVTSSFTLKNGNCQIIAGNGGNGGAGSECNGTIFNKRVGGNGGNGGAGGIGITSTSGSLTVTVNGGSLTVKGGNGGNGGTRGGVHNHGEPGAQGKGGAAGVACMSGATVTDNTDRYNGTTGKNGSEGTGTNQD
jgi:hypothetical protein